MKKIVLLSLLMAGVSALAMPGIRLELDCRNSKNECKEVVLSPGLKFSGKNGYCQVRSTEAVPAEWKEYKVSFVPTGNSFTFGFSALAKNEWVEYDDMKLDGVRIYNPSFEAVNGDGEIDGWRYYAKACLVRGAQDAADGRNYLRAGYGYFARTNMWGMKPGQRVTITFKARAAKVNPQITEKWTSSGIRKIK